MIKYKTVYGLSLSFLDNEFFLTTLCGGYKWVFSGPLTNEIVIKVLMKCKKAKFYEELYGYIKEISNLDEESINSLIHALEKTKLLVRSYDEYTEKASTFANEWKKNGWIDAFNFHLCSSTISRLDYSKNGMLKDVELMRLKLKEAPKPSLYKEYSDSKVILLEKKFIKKEIQNLSLMEHLRSNASQKKLSFADFSWFIYLAYGQTHTRKMFVTGEHIAKTSPSGGSRHPTEIYFYVENIESIPLGLYHYNVRTHSLELILEGKNEDLLTGTFLLPGQPEFERGFTVFYTTIFERSMHRYRESRSYRVLSLDVGHLIETSSAIAKALGIVNYHSYTLRDSIVEKALSLDGINESIMAISAFSY